MTLEVGVTLEVARKQQTQHPSHLSASSVGVTTPSLSSPTLTGVGDIFSPVQMWMGDVRLYIWACSF